jgi:hypothetical protein
MAEAEMICKKINLQIRENSFLLRHQNADQENLNESNSSLHQDKKIALPSSSPETNLVNLEASLLLPLLPVLLLLRQTTTAADVADKKCLNINTYIYPCFRVF